MADLTEKERLLREMKQLSEFINNAKQKGAVSSLGPKTTSSIQRRQQYSAVSRQQAGISGCHPTYSGASVRTSQPHHSGSDQTEGVTHVTTHPAPVWGSNAMLTATQLSRIQPQNLNTFHNQDRFAAHSHNPQDGSIVHSNYHQCSTQQHGSQFRTVVHNKNMAPTIQPQQNRITQNKNLPTHFHTQGSLNRGGVANKLPLSPLEADCSQTRTVVHPDRVTREVCLPSTSSQATHRSVLAHRTVVASSVKPNILSNTGRISSTFQDCEVNRVTDSATSQPALVKVEHYESVSSLPIQSQSARLMSGCPQSVQLHNSVVSTMGDPSKPRSKNRKNSAGGKYRVLFHPSTKKINTSKKDEVKSKSAQVAAATEKMQSQINSLKSKLAQLAAVKKRQQGDMTERTNPAHRPFETVTSEPVNRYQAMTEKSGRSQLKGHMHDVTEKGRSESSCFTSILPTTHIKTEPLEHLEQDTHHYQSPAISTHWIKSENHVDANESCSINMTDKTAASAWSSSEPFHTSSLSHVMTEQARASQSVHGPQSSPSKMAAKANLEKELRATKEKLMNMRTKIGVMLKESPQSSQCVVNERTGQGPSNGQSSGGSRSNQIMFTKGISSQHSEGSFSNTGKSSVRLNCTPQSQSSSKSRPFPNRASLKWTLQRFPGRKSSDNLVGDSPNIRSFQTASVMASTPKWAVNPREQNVLSGKIKRRRRSQNRRKSRYFYVRNNTTYVNSTENSPLQSVMTPVHRRPDIQACCKSIVSRYKVQKVSAASKATVEENNPDIKPMVQSRFKLLRFGSQHTAGFQTSVPGMTTLTAKQKAAEIIKSKYRIRKVPNVNPVMQQSTSYQHSHIPPQARGPVGQSNAWLIKRKRHNKSFLPWGYDNRWPSRVFSCYGDGRWRRQRDVTPLGCDQWWRGETYEDRPSGNWWARNQAFIRERARRRRAMAAEALKMLWRDQWLQNMWGQESFASQARRQREEQRLQKILNRKTYRMRRKQMKTQKRGSGRRPGRESEEHLVMIGGVVYRSSSRRLTKASPTDPRPSSSKFTGSPAARYGKQRKMHTVTVRGVSYKVDARGTSLRRLSTITRTGEKTAMSRSHMSAMRWTRGRGAERGLVSQTRYVINRVKQRSIMLAALKNRKNAGQGTKKICLYFSRFGKCSRGDKCPFLHDPAKVAVCTRFLRGRCQVENCPFSHKVSKEKMPVCSFFLRGVCTRDPCPYLHVKVNQGAQVCPDFVSGFCPLAEKCQKLHTLTCPQFAKTGTCPEGKKCRLLHRKLHTRNTRRTSATPHKLTTSPPSRKRSAEEAKHSDTTQEKHSTGPPQKRFKPDASEKKKPRQHSGHSDGEKSRSTQQSCHSDCEKSRLTQHGNQFDNQENSLKQYREHSDIVESGGTQQSHAENCKPTQHGERYDSEENKPTHHINTDAGITSLADDTLSQDLLLLVGSEGVGLTEEKNAVPHKLPSLPAFISLADYSFEASPLGKRVPSKSRFSSVPKSGTSLQIRPQL